MINRALGSLAVLVVSLGVPATAGSDPPPRTHDFEADAVGSTPAGWFVPPALRQQGVEAVVTKSGPGAGARSARLSAKAEGFANLLTSVDAAPYRGKLVRLAALVKTDRAGAPARLWLRVDRPDGRTGFFENMSDRPIGDDRWRRYEIVGPVADDALAISFGLMMSGVGTAWIDDVELTTLGPAADASERPAPLGAREMTNLVALARLLGDVRHFHPSDEAAAADWDTVAIIAVRVIQDASSDQELAERLRTVFEPLAPTIQIAVDDDPPFAGSSTPENASHVLFWQHRGYGQGQDTRGRSIYRSDRVRRAVDEPGKLGEPTSDQVSERRLTDRVSSSVPLCVWAVDARTIPPAAGHGAIEGRWPHPDGWYASFDDRATRLASVILLWNVLQHFYPYFGVIDTDWSEVLPTALRDAAETPDAARFTATLERMVAALQDGHGHVASRSAGAPGLPLSVEWIDRQLVVTAGPEPCAAGDVIVAIDGRPTEELWLELEPRISGATEGWKRHVARRRILQRPTAEPVFVEFRRPDGSGYSISLQPQAAGQLPAESKPEVVGELEDGIWYVDIDRLDDGAFIEALPELAKAEGLVLDLRGYPRVSTVVIAHLIDEPVRSAQWLIPLVHQPDRRDMVFEQSGWEVKPLAPRLSARTVFITDGRAISYAETYMGIVEAYGLAEIVGAPTAGTNGNVNSVALPTGHAIAFTGMKVLKHDGSRHHGVGIHPTIPARRTIAGVADGRDELLELAIEVVRRRAEGAAKP